MTKTADTVMHALTEFVGDWCAPAARRVFYQPGDNSYNRLLDVLAKAITPPSNDAVVRYAVFTRTYDTTYDRDRPSGETLTQASAVFEKIVQANNALAHCRSTRDGDHMICEIRECRE